MTTDNGANIVAAITKEAQWPWLNCFGHNLHLAVTNAMTKDPKTKEKTDKAMLQSRGLANAFSKSWQKRRDLGRAQEELGLDKHCLIQVKLN